MLKKKHTKLETDDDHACAVPRPSISSNVREDLDNSPNCFNRGNPVTGHWVSLGAWTQKQKPKAAQ